MIPYQVRCILALLHGGTGCVCFSWSSYNYWLLRFASRTPSSYSKLTWPEDTTQSHPERYLLLLCKSPVRRAVETCIRVAMCFALDRIPLVFDRWMELETQHAKYLGEVRGQMSLDKSAACMRTAVEAGIVNGIP